MFDKKDKGKPKTRFTEKSAQSINLGFLSVVVDNETGVNYIVTGGSAPEFITPLLNADGTIVVDKPAE